MANDVTTVGGNLVFTYTDNHNVTLNSQTGTISVDKIKLATSNTFVDKDIIVEPSVQYSVKNGNFSNIAVADVNYQTNNNENTIIPAEGALYINEGWYPATKITLGHMIPDDVDLPNAGSANIVSGFEAYDVDGKKLIGTIKADIDPSFSGGNVTIDTDGLQPTAVEVTTYNDGTFATFANTENNEAYGITKLSNADIQSGDFLTIIPTASQTAVGKVSGNLSATREVIYYSGDDLCGVLSKRDGEIALSEVSGIETGVSKSVNADIIKGATIGIKKVSPILTGGKIEESTATVTISGTAPVVTTSLDVSANGANVANYGYGYSAGAGEAEGTDYIILKATPSIAPGSYTASSSADVTTSKVTYKTATRGAVNIDKDDVAVNSDSRTITGSKTEEITATMGQVGETKIAIAKVGAVTVSSSVAADGKPKVTSTINVTGATFLTSAPGGEYVTISNTMSTTPGTVIASASYDVSRAGLITAGTRKGSASDLSVDTTNTAADSLYIKKFGGAYEIVGVTHNN